ncbi:MAG: phosphoglycerate kinase [Candidatus Shapirobacteria bacterium]|jgi:phosphoglycerate kinase
MKQLTSVEEIGSNLNVILRMDTDLSMDDGQILDNSRLKKSIPTIRYLMEKENTIVIVGHMGRPTNYDENLSLKPIYLELMSLLEMDGQNTIESVFVDDIKDETKIRAAIEKNQIIFMENLRFWNEEESGNTSLFLNLKEYCSTFVNDAFAVAHRKSASVILHREINTYYGFSFVEETEKISQILDKKERPITIILGGAKKDKLDYLIDLEKIADWILVGGKLPQLIQKEPIDNKIVIAKLREDGLDLSDDDIEKFIEIINRSKTIIWSGAMGFYEDENCREGTKEIAMAVANTDGYKIIAGGDTSTSIKYLGLKNKIDFICSGGGVMLELLTKGSLPAWI